MTPLVQQLEREVEDAEDRVRTLKAGLHAARCDAWGVHVGDLIEATHQETQLMKVATIKFWDDGGKPRLEAFKQKKNGDWFAFPNHVYGVWKVVGS